LKSVKRPAWWKRRQSLTAGEAFLLGLGVGSIAAFAAAFNPPRDFSYSFLSLLLLTIGPCGGIGGYMFWLVADPESECWLRTISNVIALGLIITLLVAVPSLWKEMGRRTGAPMIVLLPGFIFAATSIFVAAGFGVVHLSGYLLSAVRRRGEAEIHPHAKGVWDSEIDQR
jgi:hypothetical protein